jgi:hypothetical protein
MRSPSAGSSVSSAPLVELVPAAGGSVGAGHGRARGRVTTCSSIRGRNACWTAPAGSARTASTPRSRSGVVVPRQNGKDEILIARTLGGLLILEEQLITYSAHQFDTSLEAFRRLLHFFENYDELTRRVKRVSKSHGEEGHRASVGPARPVPH